MACRKFWETHVQAIGHVDALQIQWHSEPSHLVFIYFILTPQIVQRHINMIRSHERSRDLCVWRNVQMLDFGMNRFV